MPPIKSVLSGRRIGFMAGAPSVLVSSVCQKKGEPSFKRAFIGMNRVGGVEKRRGGWAE